MMNRAVTAVVLVCMALGSQAARPMEAVSHRKLSVTHAAYTTINVAADGANYCKNGPGTVNCNLYTRKEYVWMNGGPNMAAEMGAGTYFFSVLVPGGQHNPADYGSTKVLSDDYDTMADRTFTIDASGMIAYTGPHDLANNKIRFNNNKITDAVTPASATQAVGSTATFAYTVGVTNNGGVVVASSVQIHGDITLGNPNSATIHVDITVASTNGGVCAVTGGSSQFLSPGTNSFLYTCTYPSLPDVATTVVPSVTWTAQTIDGATLAAPTTDPSQTLTIAAAAFVQTKVDDCVSVTDSFAGALGTTCATNSYTFSRAIPVVYAAFEYSSTATFTTDVTSTTGSASTTVTVTGLASALTVSTTVNPAYTSTWTWGVGETVDQTSFLGAVGSTAPFNYVVTATRNSQVDSAITVTGTVTVNDPNPNSVGITSVGVTSNGVACTVTSGGAQTLAPGVATFAYTCTYASVPSGPSIQATVVWAGPQTLATPAGAVSGAVLNAGSASSTAATADFTAAGVQTKVDDCASVTDTFAGALGTTCATNSYSFSRTITVVYAAFEYSTTATFTTDDTGATGSASKTVTVTGLAAALTVSTTTVTPAYTSTWTWGISKTVDKTSVQQVGGSATFNYVVTATRSSQVDSAITVTGTVTVNNPNPNSAGITSVGITSNGNACTLATGGAQTLAPGATTFAYTCTYASVPSSASIQATVVWAGPQTLATPSGGAVSGAVLNAGSASSTAATASFTAAGVQTKVDECVTIKDTFNSVATTLGSPCATKTYSYAHTVSMPANGCQAYANTAAYSAASGASGSASKSVKACGPVLMIAKTIGFWQGPNGQKIVSGGTSTSNVCKSGIWLRQFSNFMDLPATATCAQCATYVFNTIKAANSSGDSMNSMLKAQMLSTALEVYFSSAAAGYGGNKLGSPAPIGGVVIDLTKICKPAATGSCLDASPAFGGATSSNIYDILVAIASESNVGGSDWYGQVKATQELAKNTCDGINNEVVFAPV